jgi:histidine ammonia-lyase
VPFLDVDRPPAPDIAALTSVIASGDLERACEWPLA